MAEVAAPCQPAEWPVAWQPVHGEEDGFLRRIEAVLACSALRCGARMPEPMFRVTLDLLARLARRIDRRHADAARGFLTQALGELPEEELERRVLQSYRHFFRVLVEPRRFLHRVPEEKVLEHFDIQWTDELRRVAEGPGGNLVVTPHLGNWEIAISVLARIGFGPLYAVAKPMKSRPLSVYVQEQREHCGVRLLPRRGAMTDAPTVIRSGGTIGLLLDQRARKRPVYAPFFGRPARCDRSAGVLMKRLRVPVLILCCVREEEPLRFRVEFEDCLRPEELRESSPEEIATRVNAAFERMILRHPEQYFWLHDRFKDTPSDFEALAAEEDSCPEGGATT